MINKYLILFLFLLLCNCDLYPQIINYKYEGKAKIIFAKINYEGMVTRYKPGNTRVYPPMMVPVLSRHYHCTFRIQLDGDEFINKGALNIKFSAASGKAIWWLLKPEHDFFNSNEIYEFTFDYYSEESLFGKADIEFIKYDNNRFYNRNEDEILLDKTNVFIQ